MDALIVVGALIMIGTVIVCEYYLYSRAEKAGASIRNRYRQWKAEREDNLKRGGEIEQDPATTLVRSVDLADQDSKLLLRPQDSGAHHSNESRLLRPDESPGDTQEIRHYG